MTAVAAAEPHPSLHALGRVLATWRERPSFGSAVTETVAVTGYSRPDVIHQLRHVIARTSADAMRLVLEGEGVTPELLAAGPKTVLTLASSGVPGLVLEAMAAALTIGATALVRPSHDEAILRYVLSDARELEPALVDAIELVGVGDEPLPWDRTESAIVFGTDSTVTFVRDHLAPPAARRVAAYGSRQGIAVVTPGADRTWARRVADDVLTFRQRGCMSPSWLFVVGPAERTSALIDSLGRELVRARPRHLAPNVDDRMEHRRANDADVLGAIAAGMAPDARVLYAGDARVTVVRVDDADDLELQVAALGSLLQTAVLACGLREHEALARRLQRAGCTRVCLPGHAHRPHALWRQDGIGRVAPLLA